MNFWAFIVAFEWRSFHKNCSEGNNEQLLFYFFLLFCLFTEPVNRIPVHRNDSVLYIVAFRELLLYTTNKHVLKSEAGDFVTFSQG